MKVDIIPGCISCGNCEGICPEVFKLDEEGLAEVIAEPADNDDSVRAAADSCPVSVIEVGA